MHAHRRTAKRRAARSHRTKNPSIRLGVVGNGRPGLQVTCLRPCQRVIVVRWLDLGACGGVVRTFEGGALAQGRPWGWTSSGCRFFFLVALWGCMQIVSVRAYVELWK